MQPNIVISQDIKTLADWVYEQFSPTDPMEVQNILDKPYYFKYCVGETIETPDQTTRHVVDRQYEEITFEVGETKVLMGAAAYVFVCGIAPAYVLQTKSQESMGDLAQLAEAAALSIIGKVSYSRNATPIKVNTPPVVPIVDTSAPSDHNPNALVDNNGDMPVQGNDSDAFAEIGTKDTDRFTVVSANHSDDGKAHFFVDGVEVTNAAYNKASNAANKS